MKNIGEWKQNEGRGLRATLLAGCTLQKKTEYLESSLDDFTPLDKAKDMRQNVAVDLPMDSSLMEDDCQPNITIITYQDAKNLINLVST